MSFADDEVEVEAKPSQARSPHPPARIQPRAKIGLKKNPCNSLKVIGTRHGRDLENQHARHR